MLGLFIIIIYFKDTFLFASYEYIVNQFHKSLTKESGSISLLYRFSLGGGVFWMFTETVWIY